MNPTLYKESFLSPSRYQITVEGKIEDSLLICLPGSIDINPSISGETEISILVGSFLDQAELSGLLNALYNNRFTVISVVKIN